MNRTFVASAAVAMSLLATTPVLAHSKNADVHANGEVKVNAGLHLGSVMRIFHDEHRNGDDRGNRESGETRISGKVVAINDETITVTKENGTTYAVDASNASFVGEGNAEIDLEDIEVGDFVSVRGDLEGTVMEAASVKVLSDQPFAKFSNKAMAIGTISSVGNSSFVLSPIGTTSNATVTFDSDTKFRGSADESGDLLLGGGAFVFGTTSSTTPGTISASLVVMFQDGFAFLRNMFR